MRIVFLSFYSGINNRGVERWVREISSRLSDKHKITVYQNRAIFENVPYEVVVANIDYKKRNFSKLLHRFFLDYDSIKILQFTASILKHLIKNKYDIIIPTDGGWEPAIVRIITWFKRKKMVIVGHAGIGCDDANNLWSFPNVFIALSTTAQKWAKRVNSFVKTVYIPDGVDTKVFSPVGGKVKLSFKNNYPTALCVGALEPGKRIDLVVKAVSKVKNLNLLVCGTGEMRRELGELGNKILSRRFETRQYDFEKMPEVYRACNIFLSASLPQYSFEMVIPEAMACGLPVVANDDPIREEIVGEGGLLVEVTNIGIFTDTIKKALKKNWRNKPIDQAGKFEWEGIVKRYEEVMEKTLNKKQKIVGRK